MADHLTAVPEDALVRFSGDTEGAVERARALHHLASADPELDGELTAEEHAAKYGLGRPEVPAARGKHEAPVEAPEPAPVEAPVEAAIETTAAPRASDK